MKSLGKVHGVSSLHLAKSKQDKKQFIVKETSNKEEGKIFAERALLISEVDCESLLKPEAVYEHNSKTMICIANSYTDLTNIHGVITARSQKS